MNPFTQMATVLTASSIPAWNVADIPEKGLSRTETIRRLLKAANRPVTAANQTDLALAAHMAFDSVQRGTADAGDRDTLVCMTNVHMILCEKHCSPSDLADALTAQEALLRADGRVLQGKRWNFDGEGRAAMLTAIHAHQQLIAQLGQAAITDALLTMRERRARGQVHRVELAAQVTPT